MSVRNTLSSLPCCREHGHSSRATQASFVARCDGKSGIAVLFGTGALSADASAPQRKRPSRRLRQRGGHRRGARYRGEIHVESERRGTSGAAGSAEGSAAGWHGPGNDGAGGPGGGFGYSRRDVPADHARVAGGSQTQVVE